MVAQNSFKNLTSSEIQQVMDVCEQLHHTSANESFLTHCHRTMNQMLGGIHFAAELYQLAPFAPLVQEIHTIDNDYWIPLFQEHIMDHPRADRMINQPGSEISATYREPSLMQFTETTLYNEFYRQVEAENQIWIGLRDGNELLNCVYSRREVYTEENLAMLSMIQPHLELAWKTWRNTRTLQQELDLLKGVVFQSPEEEAKAATIRKAIERLTNRQRDVMELVSLGKDNQQISDELKISSQTVKKHMQAIFLQLDAQHRTQLAAMWYQAHSIPIL